MDIESQQICLSDVHPSVYSIMYSPDEECQYCHMKAYLSLVDKVIRWCGNKDFCKKKKMTAHWMEKDRWLNVVGGSPVKHEI